MMTELCGKDLDFKRGQWCELPAGHKGMCSGRKFNWMVGDQVSPCEGFKGVAVAVFKNLADEPCVVVEYDYGFLSTPFAVYSPEQLFRTGRTEA